MERKIYFAFGVVLLALVMSSCSDRVKIAKEYAEFARQTVVLPSSFHAVVSGRIQIASDIPDKPVMILYNDSLSCSMCRIGHLHDMLPIYEQADNLGTFEVMTILSPKQEDYVDVVNSLLERDFEYPIYVDYTGDFRRLNSFIPEDERFHSFLIDRDRKPVFVGNPIRGEALWKLF